MPLEMLAGKNTCSTCNADASLLADGNQATEPPGHTGVLIWNSRQAPLPIGRSLYTSGRITANQSNAQGFDNRRCAIL